jgi:hypothetical protein
MKKIMFALACIALASCGGDGISQKPTWQEVYKLIDSKQQQSVIDRAITDAGIETHPASITVLAYFDHFMAGEAEKALGYVNPGSSFANSLGGVDKLNKTIQDGKLYSDYQSVVIKGLSITGLDASNARYAKVMFALSIIDKTNGKLYESIGYYNLKEINGNWLIDSAVNPRNEPK